MLNSLVNSILNFLQSFVCGLFDYSKWVFQSFQTALYYKHGSLIVLGIPISLTLEILLNSSFLGISVTFIFLLVFLMIADFWTGIIAARFKGEDITSRGVSYTFYKAFSYVFFFWMLAEVNKMLDGKAGWVYEQGLFTNAIIRNVIFIILSFREFISVGENIEKRFGRKPYIFTLATKVVDIIEDKFIKKIADSNICNDKEDEPKSDKK